MTKRQYYILILLVIQPVLDIITGIMRQTNVHVNLSIGAFVKAVIMIFIFIYLIHYFLTQNSRLLWLLTASLVSIVMMLIVNVLLKPNFSFFAEINFAVKTSYYVALIFLVMTLPHTNLIKRDILYRAVKLIALIIGISYWLAVFTGTSIESYTYEGAGYSGWFYSANELSVTIIILLGLTLGNFSYEEANVITANRSNAFKEHTFSRRLSRIPLSIAPTSWLAFLLMLSMTPMIGTKTAFAAGILLTYFYTFYRFLKYKWQFQTILLAAFVILFSFLLPFSPVIANTTTINLEDQSDKNDIRESDRHTESSNLTKVLLSSRNIYFKQIKGDFLAAKKMRKLFGIGFAGDFKNEPKLIEMDFFDLFFSYGYIGTFWLLLPLAYLATMLFIFPISEERLILMLTLGLCVGISFIAGHVLFAPAVMTYVAILLFVIRLEIIEQRKKSLSAK